MRGRGVNPTKTQNWFRNFSDRLSASFRASGQIEHKVTKGETREHQILDVLQVLPKAFALERDVVIIDASDQESPKFDGVLFNRQDWPLLYHENPHFKVIMFESVRAVIETKSHLDDELSDIFAKGQRLRKLQTTYRKPAATQHPLYVAFSYECRNVGLTFFDLAMAFVQTPTHAPSIIALLNVGLFACRVKNAGGLANIPGGDDVPLFIETKHDTVLALLYLLCTQISESEIAEVFKTYSAEFFNGVPAFSFDADFVAHASSTEDSRQTARNCFKGKPNQPLEELYAIARNALGI